MCDDHPITMSNSRRELPLGNREATAFPHDGRVWLVLERTHYEPPVVFAICSTKARALTCMETLRDFFPSEGGSAGYVVASHKLDELSTIA